MPRAIPSESRRREFSWNLNYGGIALLWRRLHHRSAFLGKIKEAFDRDRGWPTCSSIRSSGKRWSSRRKHGACRGDGGGERDLDAAMTTALNYYDGYRTNGCREPAAGPADTSGHMYERVDRPRGQFFHTNWTGRGGDTASTTYVV